MSDCEREAIGLARRKQEPENLVWLAGRPRIYVHTA